MRRSDDSEPWSVPYITSLIMICRKRDIGATWHKSSAAEVMEWKGFDGYEQIIHLCHYLKNSIMGLGFS